MKRLCAIVAMSVNRVIGKGNTIPWHLPDDFKWFKRRTMGGTLVMGRRTFESIGRPLPGRKTVIVSRAMEPREGVEIVRGLDELWEKVGTYPEDVFIAGGGEIYRQTLDRCTDVYLTIVKREVEDGEAFFPEFESKFDLSEVIEERDEFEIRHYVRRDVS